MTSRPSPQHDRTLLSDAIARAGRGEKDALRYVYDHSSAKLMGVCLRILNDRQAAEDVLQEVFIKIWRGAEAFDPSRASPVTWMCTIARNTAIDHHRTARRRSEGVAAVAADPAFDAEPVDPVADHADRVRMRECLDWIEDRQRGAICSAFFEGFTYRELAERASVPLGTMKSWVRRGLERLRECLDG